VVQVPEKSPESEGDVSVSEKTPKQAAELPLPDDLLRVLGEVIVHLDEDGRDCEQARRLRLLAARYLYSLRRTAYARGERLDCRMPVTRHADYLDALDTAVMIARSSLGTPAARGIRRQTSAAQIGEILRRRDELMVHQPATADRRTASQPVRASRTVEETARASGAAGARAAEGPARETAVPVLTGPGRRAADEEFVAALYAEHGRALLRYALHLTRGDRQHAEDLVQETIIRAWRHLDRLAGRLARPWLFATARSLAADEYRARRRNPAPAAMPTVHDPDRELVYRDIADAFASLSPEQRSILTACYAILSVEDTAATLGITPGNVLRALKHALEERGAGARLGNKKPYPGPNSPSVG
jgi:RNA polymerase sigma-70 factor, ECF subfamily